MAVWFTSHTRKNIQFFRPRRSVARIGSCHTGSYPPRRPDFQAFSYGFGIRAVTNGDSCMLKMYQRWSDLRQSSIPRPDVLLEGVSIV
jgi:hypothetical protein